eukprot:Sdes_comp18715_c0_seq1m9035
MSCPTEFTIVVFFCMFSAFKVVLTMMSVLSPIMNRMMSSNHLPRSLSAASKQLYKQLLYMGREYPAGYEYFRNKCKSAFLKNKCITDPEEHQKCIEKGNFILRELEALYKLRKYRKMRRNYYDPY